MARARLHLICGNCGCDDEFDWTFYPRHLDHGDDTFSDEVGIKCNNCSTIHWLSDRVTPSERQAIEGRRK